MSDRYKLKVSRWDRESYHGKRERRLQVSFEAGEPYANLPSGSFEMSEEQAQALAMYLLDPNVHEAHVPAPPDA